MTHRLRARRAGLASLALAGVLVAPRPSEAGQVPPAEGPTAPKGSGGPSWVRLEAVTVQARATSLLYLPVARDAPTGRQRIALEVEVANLHVGPGRELVVTIPLEITVGP